MLLNGREDWGKVVIQGIVNILFTYLFIDATAVFEGCSGDSDFFLCVCARVCVGVQCGISAVAPGVDL